MSGGGRRPWWGKRASEAGSGEGAGASAAAAAGGSSGVAAAANGAQEALRGRRQARPQKTPPTPRTRERGKS